MVSDPSHRDAPRGTVTFTGSKGTVAPASCQAESHAVETDHAECTITYTPTAPTAARTDTITATYAGNLDYASSKGTTTLQVLPGATPSPEFSCVPQDTVMEGHQLTCHLRDFTVRTVNGVQVHPTGKITFSTSGKGTFSPAQCTYDVTTGFVSFCDVTYTPTVTGVARRETVTVSYAGDRNFAPAKVTDFRSVLARVKPTFGFGCGSQEYRSSQCILSSGDDVHLEDGTGGVPTGNVTLTATRGKGTLDHGAVSEVCPLRFEDFDVTCRVDYTPIGAGSPSRADTITMSYPGDAVYAPVKMTYKVPVPARPKPRFSVGCYPDDSVLEGTTKECSLLTSDKDYLPSGSPVYPTGSVTLTATKGTFGGYASPQSCPLQFEQYEFSFDDCYFNYTPTGAGSPTRKDTITLTYAGDQNFGPTTVTYQISVTARPKADLEVSCDPATVVETNSVYCTVVSTSSIGPRDGSGVVPQGNVAFKSSAGTFTGSSTCTLQFDAFPNYEQACSVLYTPSGAGSAYRKDTITASYPGDPNWGAATATTTLPVTARPKPVGFEVNCAYNNVEQGHTVYCFSGPGPSDMTGTVTFSSSTGTFSPTTCAYAPMGHAIGGVPFGNQCLVQYTPSGKGSATRKDTITAKYSGSSAYAAFTDTGTVAVTLYADTVAASCAGPATAGTKVTCTATVTGSNATLPTGKVSFAVDGGVGTGAFSPSSCILATQPAGPPACSVTYISKAKTAFDYVDVSYAGSADYKPGTATTAVATH